MTEDAHSTDDEFNDVEETIEASSSDPSPEQKREKLLVGLLKVWDYLMCRKRLILILVL